MNGPRHIDIDRYRTPMIDALKRSQVISGAIQMSTQIRDLVIELLEEQEQIELRSGLVPAKPVMRDIRVLTRDGERTEPTAYCGNCDMPLVQETVDGPGWQFCAWCGRRIEWK